MEQGVFRPLHYCNQGICILNWKLKKIYENEKAKKIFAEQCPELYQQFREICKKAGSMVIVDSNPLVRHSGILHCRYGTIIFSCLFLGQGGQTCIYILFDYTPYTFPGGSKMAGDITLTPREKDIVQVMALGKTNKEISQILCIGLETVKSHIRNLFAKLQVSSRAELVGKVLKMPHDS